MVNNPENLISRNIVKACYKIYNSLGPGLLESAYEEILCYELAKFNYFIERQKPIPLIYEEIKLNAGYRADIVVEKKVIIEIKAIEYMAPVHKMQLLTYLKLSGIKLGLLINFNVEILKDGIKRVVNNL